MSQRRPAKRRRCADSDEDLPPRKQVRGEDAPEETQAESVSENFDRDPNDYSDTALVAGVIEKLRLKDFMCHKLFEINLANVSEDGGLRICFIHGPNGAGKSAILTAICIALGATASKSGRGGRLGDMIREGASSATVRIQLRNRGNDAYKYGTYGPSIIIERRINRDNNEGKYTIMTHDETVVSRKKSDLTAILDQFNIQVTNPCVILDQDQSRTFLHAVDDKKLYKFFMEATGSASLKRNFEDSEISVGAQEKLLEAKKLEHKKAKDRIQELKEKVKSVDKVVKLRNEIGDMKKMLVWAHVESREKEADIATKKLQDLEDRLLRIPSGEEEKRTLDEQKEMVSELTTSLVSMSDVVKEQKEAVMKANGALKSRRRDILQLENQRKHEMQNIVKLKNKIVDVEKTIKEATEQALKSQGEFQSEKEAKVQEQKSEIEQYSHRDKELKEQYEDLISQRDEAIQLEQELASELRRIEDEEGRLKRDLQEKKGKGNGVASNFGGRAAEALVQKIRKTNFPSGHKPIGPLGSVISLTDKRWAVAVECALKVSLQAYVCHDRADEKVLQRLSKDAGYSKHPHIIIQKFRDDVYPIPADRLPDSSFLSILQILRSDYPMAINALIDQQRIESCVLFDTYVEANKSIRGREMPRNVWQGFTEQGDQHVIRNGAKSHNPNTMNRRATLGMDEKEVISELQERLKWKSDEKRRATAALRDAKAAKENAQLKIGQCKKEKELARRKLDIMNKALQDLLEEDDVIDEDVSMYELEIERLKDLIAKGERTTEALANKISELNSTMPALSDTQKTEKSKLQELVKENESIKRQVDELEEKYQEIERKHSKLVSKRDKLTEMVTKQKRECDVIAEALADVSRKAVEYCESCERTEVTWSVEEIHRKIAKLEKTKNEEEKKKGNVDELFTELEKSYKIEANVALTLKEAEGVAKRQRDQLKERMHRFKESLKSTERQVRQRFFSCLTKLDGETTGNMKFDHKKETLSVQITRGNHQQSTNMASGGERSLITGALLYSLWHVVQAPFVAVDEPDVFQDSAAIQKTMRMYLKCAKDLQGRQFIFITPHGQSLPTDKEVRIQKLLPIDRSGIEQGTLDESFGIA